MNKLSVIVTGVVGVAVIIGASLGIANAASNNSSIGSSGIPRNIFREERLDAVAQVLNTSTSNIKTARKDKTLKNLISQADLTQKSFDQKVRAQLISDLESKGYSQSQITIALQHRSIVRLRHHRK